MNQGDARAAAQLLNELRPAQGPHVATTLCAHRGQFEQGPDADLWIVIDGRSLQVEVKVES